MTDPVEPRPKSNWLWPVVIGLLGLLLVVWMFSPSGEREGEVADPIVTGDLADPDAETGAGVIGEGLPDANGVAVGPDAPGAGVGVERQPTDEPLPVPSPAIPLPPGDGQER